MPATETLIQWAVAAIGTGGVAKFVIDIFNGRRQGRKTEAEGAVILVDSAAGYAQSVVSRLERVENEFADYKREQENRNRVQDRFFRLHARWDNMVLKQLEIHGTPVPEPPPLYPEPE